MYLEKVYYGDSFDEEPDIFYYSNLNNNGQFVLRRPKSYSDPTYSPVLIPAGPETFVKSDFNSGGFRMKNTKGNLYYYGDNSNYTEYTSNSNGDNPTTCWKASKIISPRNDTISFTYAGGRYTRYPANLDYYGVEDMDILNRQQRKILLKYIQKSKNIPVPVEGVKNVWSTSYRIFHPLLRLHIIKTI